MARRQVALSGENAAQTFAAIESGALVVTRVQAVRFRGSPPIDMTIPPLDQRAALVATLKRILFAPGTREIALDVEEGSDTPAGERGAAP